MAYHSPRRMARCETSAAAQGQPTQPAAAAAMRRSRAGPAHNANQTLAPSDHPPPTGNPADPLCVDHQVGAQQPAVAGPGGGRLPGHSGGDDGGAPGPPHAVRIRRGRRRRHPIHPWDRAGMCMCSRGGTALTQHAGLGSTRRRSRTLRHQTGSPGSALVHAC